MLKEIGSPPRAKLLADEVNAGDLLGDRMLDRMRVFISQK